MRRPFRRSRKIESYKAPGKDSARAKATAMRLLSCARTLDAISVDLLTTSYNLKPATAQLLIDGERRRRERMV